MKATVIKIILLSYFNLFVLCVFGQEKKISADSIEISKSKLSISDFAHIRPFGTFEQHSNFTIKYTINQELFLELGGNFDTYMLADVFKSSIIGRKYVSRKLNLFSGIEMEMQREVLNSNSLVSPQFRSKNGVGYDINNNFQLQIEHDLNFNKTNVGIYSFPELLSLKGKIKF